MIEPISKKTPTGEDIRTTANAALYLDLRDARQAARHIERQIAQGNHPAATADWTAVYDKAVLLLSTKTKDLEIAAWLCEAMLRLYGFQGLAESFKIIQYYIENYWDQLYPLPDEEGLYNRIAPLEGLNGNDTDGTLIIPLATVPLTEAKSSPPFSLWQYQQAAELLKLPPEKKEQRIAAGTPSLEMIEAAAAETSSEFFKALLTDIQNCLDLFEIIDAILTEKCGADAPPTSRIHTKLKECLNAVQIISKQTVSAPIAAENIIPEEMITAEALPVSYHLSDREKILQSVLKAAQYFRQTEPHSPLPYLLERAVRWGKMPLPELLRELVTDEPAWTQLCSLTGIDRS